jgi:hypothetical protein
VFVGSYAFEVVLYFELLHVSSLGLMNHMNIVLKFLIVVFYYIIWSTDTPRVGHVPVFDTDTTCVRHRHDINTYDYIELCYFLKLLLVSTCLCRVRCPCLCPCFNLYLPIHSIMKDDDVNCASFVLCYGYDDCSCDLHRL